MKKASSRKKIAAVKPKAPGAAGTHTSVTLFDSVRLGTLPARREHADLVIG